MADNNDNNLESRTTQELEFQGFVKSQFELLFARMNAMEVDLRSEIKASEARSQSEMIERFVQLSRQVRQLDKMMDVFIADHLTLKEEWREMRDSQSPRN